MNRLLRKTKFLGFVLYIAGVLGFLALSQHDLNYETYISENALLIGMHIFKHNYVFNRRCGGNVSP